MQHIPLHQHQIYHALSLHSILTTCHPFVLMQTPVVKVCITTNNPLSAQNSNTLLPLLFSSGTPKAPITLSFVLSPIHPFRSPRMHSLYGSIPYSIQNPVHVIPESALFFKISYIGAVPYHHTNFNPRKLEFNPENSRANIPKVYHCTVLHIVQQDDHTFPSSFHLLDTSNHAIYSIP